MTAPRLSVITRTCDRLPFLERAFESIRNAAPENTEWLIINDGVDTEAVEDFVNRIKKAPNLPAGWVVKLNSTRGAGRSTAANAGFDLATGQYIHLHDDDDVVTSEFYNKSIEFLEKKTEFGGVCTHANRITERYQNNAFKTIRSAPHNPELKAISFAGVATAFLCPPICFVMRREAQERVGQFDPTLDIAEDYSFFLQFLVHHDIGVIREVLCAVHQREPDASLRASWRNSEALDDHQTYEAQLRNRYFREDLASGKVGLGWLLVLGEMSAGGRRINILIDILRRNKALSWLSAGLRRSKW